MSRYNVSIRDATIAETLLAASIGYDNSPWNAAQFTHKEYYIRMIDEVVDRPAVLAYAGSVLAGALSVSDLVQDTNIPGTGVHVYHMAVAPQYPDCLRAMLKELRTVIRSQGGSWYNLSRRDSAHVITSRYWRL